MPIAHINMLAGAIHGNDDGLMMVFDAIVSDLKLQAFQPSAQGCVSGTLVDKSLAL